MSNLPLRISYIADLQCLGLSPSSFRFGILTIESEKCICACEIIEGSTQIVIVELQSNNNVIHLPIKAEAAIINPQYNIIALKKEEEKNSSYSHVVQIYSLDSKTHLKSHNFNEQIVYWKWLSTTKLAIITSNSIFHWDINTNDTPL